MYMLQHKAEIPYIGSVHHNSPGGGGVCAGLQKSFLALRASFCSKTKMGRAPPDPSPGSAIIDDTLVFDMLSWYEQKYSYYFQRF